jgi:Tol biopolymer transport system component
VDGVANDSYASHYGVSSRGDLAYLPGATTQDLVLVDAAGQERLVVKEPMAFQNPQFSPDGKHLAVATGRTTSDRTEIWMHHLRSGEASPLTFDGGRAPVWSPDGASITYSKLSAPAGIYRIGVNGRGKAELILPLEEFHWLVGWTPDSRTLVYGWLDSHGPSSLLALTNGQRRVIVGPGSIWGGRLSPDGRWLAYYVLEAGRFRVYVTPFPAADARWLVSEDGGRDPSWDPRENQLYYRSGDRLMSVRLDTTGGVRVTGRRQVLSAFAPPLYDDYDIHPDGRTLVHVRQHAEPDREVVVVLNAFADLDDK